MAFAYFFVYGSIMVFQATWAMKYFDTTYEFVFSVGWLITMLAVGKILSTAIIGVMNGRGIIASKRKAMFWGTLLYTATWAIIWLYAGGLESYWFWMAVCFTCGFSGGFMTLSFTQVKEWYPTAIAGTSVSMVNVFLMLGGAVCTLISDQIIGKTYSLGNFSLVWALMFVFSVIAVLMVILSVEKKEGDPFVGSDKNRTK
jgi:MFS family permease